MRGRLTALALGCVAALSCAKVDYVEIEPSQVLLKRRGEGLGLRAKPMSRNGVYYPHLPIVWKSDDPKVARIDPSGQLTAVGFGHTVVTARAGGQSASVDVDVQTVESVRISPDKVEMKADGPAFRPEVAPLDGAGHVLRNRTIEMKAADENVADVDGEQIWPVGPGHTVVTIRADDRTAQVDVTVTGTAKAKGKRHK
ncbi:MAG: Ig-like domain-containing protein [Myxococcales bacterium]